MFGTEKQPRPLPRVLVDEATEAAYPPIDPSKVADIFEAAGVENVADHTLDVSSRRRFNGGATAPKWLDRLVNGRNESNVGTGAVVRMHTSTKLRPKLRTPEKLEELLTHEAVHVAQIEHGNKSLMIGFATMIALSALGAAAGNRLARRGSIPVKAAAIAIGGLLGYKAGYQAAAHERQARSHAKKHNKPSIFGDSTQ